MTDHAYDPDTLGLLMWLLGRELRRDVGLRCTLGTIYCTLEAQRRGLSFRAAWTELFPDRAPPEAGARVAMDLRDLVALYARRPMIPEV